MLNLEIHIIDNGVGIKGDNSAGFGILGMRERTENMGGVLKIQALAEQGTDVEVSIPLAG